MKRRSAHDPVIRGRKKNNTITGLNKCVLLQSAYDKSALKISTAGCGSARERAALMSVCELISCRECYNLQKVTSLKMATGVALLQPKIHVKRKYELDPDTLDCTVCMEPLNPPVFQCVNGHITCSVCWKKLSKRCPSCLRPIRTRNLAVEKVIESLRVSCGHSVHGCHDMPQFSLREEHERLCGFQPWNCPSPDCNHSGPRSDHCSHLTNVHGIRTVQFGIPGLAMKTTCIINPLESFVILESADDYEYRSFLLHHEKIMQGDVFFITSFEKTENYMLKVYPQNMLNGTYVMKTVTKDISDGENWRTALRFHS